MKFDTAKNYRPIGGEEFTSIMRNMTSSLAGRFKTLSALEAAAISQINYNLPSDYWSNYSSSLRSLTESQIAVAAKKFIRPGEVVWIIVGDLSKIEKGICELKLSEVIKINSDGEKLN